MSRRCLAKLAALVFLALASASLYGEVVSGFHRTQDGASGKTRYIYMDSQCSVAVTVHGESSINRSVLAIERECPLEFALQVGLIAVLLAQVSNDGCFAFIRQVAWDGILPSDTEIRRRLAFGALGSSEWRKLVNDGMISARRKNNPGVAQLIQDAGVFSELFDVFMALGFQVSIIATEGWGVKNLGETDVMDDSIKSNADFLVPYQGSLGFDITPL